MFVVFLLTQSRDITLGSLFPVADISGWLQGGRYLTPLPWVLMKPLCLIPFAFRHLALHFETCVCSALTVFLLARSVMLLPQDRTPDQRNLEHSEYSTFSGPFCWIPPIFAVCLMCFERTYWESSIEATSRIFSVLGFAYCVRCLLEFRLDGKDSWFVKFALVYGLLMSDGWLAMGLFPVAVASVIWIKGLRAFEPDFIRKVALSGLAGLLLLFLLPLMNQLNPNSGGGFWVTLGNTLSEDKKIIMGFPRLVALMLLLTTLLPFLVIGVKWGTSFGDNSPFGIFIASATFNLINGLFFLAGIWVCLESSINPRVKFPGNGDVFLPLNFLGALALGYFAAYFLLVYGSGISKTNRLNPLKPILDRLITGIVLLIIIAAPICQLAKNIPFIQTKRHLQSALLHQAKLLRNSLPQEGAVVLSDDQVRIYYVRSLIHQEAAESKYLFMDTVSLLHRTNYARLLQDQNSSFPIASSWTTKKESLFQAADQINFLDAFSKSHPVYYLHGSFGHFFEHFYGEQHDLALHLIPYPEETWDVPLPSSDLISSNNLFFQELAKDEDLHFLSEMARAAEVPNQKTLWWKFNKKLHLDDDVDYYCPTINRVIPLLSILAPNYSKSLNEWGITLQKANLLNQARTCFQLASDLCPQNGSAKLNLLSNKFLESGQKLTLGKPKEVEAILGNRFQYSDSLFMQGGVDEPTFLVELGLQFSSGGNYRQSVQCFHRALQIAQNKVPLILQLSQLEIGIQNSPNQLSQFYAYTNCYREALDQLEGLLKDSPDFPPALFGKSVALIQMRDFDNASKTLSQFLEKEPGNTSARLNRAITYVQTGKLDDAKEDYKYVVHSMPESYPAYYGLGEIYYRQKDAKAALRNYEFYLNYAPAETDEAKFVKKRIDELKSGAL